MSGNLLSRSAQRWAERLLPAGAAIAEDALAGDFESLLAARDPAKRKKYGVYYTPPEIARFVVREVDAALREEFGLASGLLADDSRIRILDPALGGGVFLTELIHYARRQAADVEVWNEVAPSLLSRLGGIEILPEALAHAVVRIAAALEATGYRFESDATIDLRCGDALAAPLRPAWSVILGNPPFSGISARQHRWLHKLMRGEGPSGEMRASYFDVAGAPLGERKHWLADDYVQFLRVAHEQIETAGFGIVALVTNHGYLDNVSFRGLRDKLAETFPRMSFLDLHGNAKRREKSPDGSRDENVFAIEQGVAICLLRRPLAPMSEQMERADLWGTRSEKLLRLDASRFKELAPRAINSAVPGAAFINVAGKCCPHYAAAWPLDAIFPLNTTAPVTARDHFVVAHTREELAARCADFIDRSLSDDAIRAKYFTRTRSRNYAAGDTRGWKLAEARARMRDCDWQALVRPVLYRPFDERVMLWAEWLIDWPRTEVTRHLSAGPNVTLIARRQSPANQPWTFAWVSDRLALDGIVRSDNCGSESLFPLWLYERGERRANLSPEFVVAMQQAAGRACRPEEICAYCYGLMSSNDYRHRYARELAGGFPRIPLPRAAEDLERFATLGQTLMNLSHVDAAGCEAGRIVGELPNMLPSGYPRHAEGRIHLAPGCYLDDVSTVVWDYYVGSHQVCRKWLRDRRGRQLTRADWSNYAALVQTIERLLTLTNNDAALRTV